MTRALLNALCGIILCNLLSACASGLQISDRPYVRAQSQYLYGLEKWRFNGRLALHGKQDSWSANIDWRHWRGQEQLKLSGPLGQGAVSISLSAGCIIIDKGGKERNASCEPDELIRQWLGVFVPVRDLSFWVLGLPEPEHAFEEIPDGFRQSGWNVLVLQSMQVSDMLMPHKIVITNKHIKLKLVIDQWELNDQGKG